jgi:SAM-dependent methyltransferase
MTTINLQDSNQDRYAKLHQGVDAVARYKRKLDNRMDQLRHGVEVGLLKRWCHGSILDCTVGVGRFIGHLPNVTKYDGMDLSNEFIDYVRATYPGTYAVTGDLLADIPFPDSSYDNILCLRSLSGIGHLSKILPEMVRVTRPGGLVVFDYGRKATVTQVKGVRTVLDDEDVDAAIAMLDAQLVERVRVDAFLTRVKSRAWLFRFLNGPRGRMLSDEILLNLERWMVPLLWQRQIVVLRRNGVVG